MVIFSVVIAVSYSILITVQKQARDISGREETVGQARLALEQAPQSASNDAVVVSQQYAQAWATAENLAYYNLLKERYKAQITVAKPSGLADPVLAE